MAFSAFLDHFSNCARKINLLSIVIPSAAYSVLSFIVFPCNFIFFVDSRISSRIPEKMTFSVFGPEILRRLFPIHVVSSSQFFGDAKELLPSSRMLKHVWRHQRTFQFYFCILGTFLQCRR